MKVVIAGGGRVGSALAESLQKAKHSVTVIDRDKAVCDRLFEDLGVLTIHGDATDPRVLESAGIAAAEIATAALSRDPDNLAFSVLVRSLSAARVMVRMLDEQFRHAYRIAGARDIIAEAEIVVAKMTTAIDFPQIAGSIPIAGSELLLFELKLDTKSLVVGKTIAEVRADPTFPRDCLFIGLVSSANKVEVPTGESMLISGQTAILVVRRDQVSIAVKALTNVPAPEQADFGNAASLRRIDFLAPLSESELLGLATGMQLVRKSAGDRIFAKGDQGDKFYLVLAGEVSLGDAGHAPETILPGGFFGEISLLTGEPRSATAHAVSDSELAGISRSDFRRVLLNNPTIALEMSRILGQRLATAAARSETRRGFFGRKS